MAEHISGMDLYFFGISKCWYLPSCGVSFTLARLSLGDCSLKSILENVKNFESHIERYDTLYPWHQIKKDHYFTLDFKTVFDDKLLVTAWSSFRVDLLANTEFTLNCLGLAMHHYISRVSAQSTQMEMTLPVIRARILNHGPLLPMKDINVCSFGNCPL